MNSPFVVSAHDQISIKFGPRRTSKTILNTRSRCDIVTFISNHVSNQLVTIDRRNVRLGFKVNMKTNIVNKLCPIGDIVFMTNLNAILQFPCLLLNLKQYDYISSTKHYLSFSVLQTKISSKLNIYQSFPSLLLILQKMRWYRTEYIRYHFKIRISKHTYQTISNSISQINKI